MIAALFTIVIILFVCVCAYERELRRRDRELRASRTVYRVAHAQLCEVLERYNRNMIEWDWASIASVERRIERILAPKRKLLTVSFTAKINEFGISLQRFNEAFKAMGRNVRRANRQLRRGN